MPELNNEQIIVECKNCKGTGYPRKGQQYDSDGNRLICPDCVGIGEVLDDKASTRRKRRRRK